LQHGAITKDVVAGVSALADDLKQAYYHRQFLSRSKENLLTEGNVLPGQELVPVDVAGIEHVESAEAG